MDAPTSVPSDPESQEVYPGECEQNHALVDLLQVLACLVGDIPLVLLTTRGGLRILMQPGAPLTADTIDRYRALSETIAPSHDPVFIADARLDEPSARSARVCHVSPPTDAVGSGAGETIGRVRLNGSF